MTLGIDGLEESAMILDEKPQFRMLVPGRFTKRLEDVDRTADQWFGLDQTVGGPSNWARLLRGMATLGWSLPYLLVDAQGEAISGSAAPWRAF